MDAAVDRLAISSGQKPDHGDVHAGGGARQQ